MIAGNGTKMKDRWNIVGCVLFCFVVFGVQAQQQHPVNKKAWGLFQQARESFREGDKEKALGLLLKAETFDQGFSPLYLLKADIYNKKGDNGFGFGFSEKSSLLLFYFGRILFR